MGMRMGMRKMEMRMAFDPWPLSPERVHLPHTLSLLTDFDINRDNSKKQRHPPLPLPVGLGIIGPSGLGLEWSSVGWGGESSASGPWQSPTPNGHQGHVDGPSRLLALICVVVRAPSMDRMGHRGAS
jgi:hypothetical protein